MGKKTDKDIQNSEIMRSVQYQLEHDVIAYAKHDINMALVNAADMIREKIKQNFARDFDKIYSAIMSIDDPAQRVQVFLKLIEYGMPKLSAVKVEETKQEDTSITIQNTIIDNRGNKIVN